MRSTQSVPQVFILTNSFPFLGGEQFLEPEVAHWDLPWEVVFIPKTLGVGPPRPLLGNMQIDISVARGRFRPVPRWFSALAQVFRLTLVEFGTLAGSPSNWKLILAVMRSAAETLRILYGLQQVVAARGKPVLVYAYWNDTAAYAAILAKRMGLIERVISRAHGFDVYSERRRSGYQPFKRQLLPEFDAVYPVTWHAFHYMQDRYGLTSNQGAVHRLGVRQPGVPTACSEPGHLHIVTISSCVGVKRLDMVIEGLRRAAAESRGIHFRWTHIGDGPLRSALEEGAGRLLGALPNVTHEFLGEIPNEAVHAWLETEQVDVALNTSSSEATPVALQEAMSHGIPAIAPDVDAVGELVNACNGLLLSPSPTPDEVSAAIITALGHAKEPEIRAHARDTIAENYLADDNHPAFVAACLRIAGDSNSGGLGSR